jgi:hypothetical protein
MSSLYGQSESSLFKTAHRIRHNITQLEYRSLSGFKAIASNDPACKNNVPIYDNF